jgi:hypothetical protein
MPAKDAAAQNVTTPTQMLEAIGSSIDDHNFRDFSDTMTYNLTEWPAAVVRCKKPPAAFLSVFRLPPGPATKISRWLSRAGRRKYLANGNPRRRWPRQRA